MKNLNFGLASGVHNFWTEVAKCQKHTLTPTYAKSDRINRSSYMPLVWKAVVDVPCNLQRVVDINQ